MIGCGNDPRTTLTPGDQAEVDRFKAHLADKKNKPRVVCICGSMRFQAEMQEHAEFESLQGHIVVMPHVNMKAWTGRLRDDLEGAVKTRLDALHRAKIRMAQEVLVVGDYVGESTTAEIAYARYLGIPVRFTHPEVDPERVVMSAEEIEAWPAGAKAEVARRRGAEVRDA